MSESQSQESEDPLVKIEGGGPLRKQLSNSSTHSIGGSSQLSRAYSNGSATSDGSYCYSEDNEYVEDEDKGMLAQGYVIPCNKGSKHINFNLPYSVSPTSVVDMVASIVQSTSDLFGLSEAIMLILMQKFRFDQTVLQESLFENTDALLLRHKINRQACKLTIEAAPEWGCMICGEDENVEFLSLGCGHTFCRICYTRYCAEKIKDGDLFSIRCMEPNCSIVPGREAISAIVGDSGWEDYIDADVQAEAGVEAEAVPGGATQGAATATATAQASTEQSIINSQSPPPQTTPSTIMDKYTIFLANVLIQNRPDLVCCTQQACGEIMYIPPNFADISLTCMGCQYNFCSNCSKEAHEPCSCTIMEEWMKKEKSDGMNAVWIIENTKACPKCRVAIQRSTGCDIMLCAACRHEFCWMCFKPRTHGPEHNNHMCNVPNKELTNDPDKNRRNLALYHHYWDRYQKHSKFQATEVANRKVVSERAQKIDEVGAEAYLQSVFENAMKSEKKQAEQKQGGGVPALEPELEPTSASASFLTTTDYLLTAYDALVNCRRTLKYTYIYCYFMGEKLGDLEDKEKKNREKEQKKFDFGTAAASTTTHTPPFGNFGGFGSPSFAKTTTAQPPIAKATTSETDSSNPLSKDLAKAEEEKKLFEQYQLLLEQNIVRLDHLLEKSPTERLAIINQMDKTVDCQNNLISNFTY